MIKGRTRLHVVANGTMTGQRYIDEVLLPHVRLFRGAVDLNPIENVWNALGRQVAGRNYPPTNKNTLIRALTEEWDKLPQQLLDNVVQSKCPTPGLALHTTVAPAVQKMSRRSKERAGSGKERLYPLHKKHTTQVTPSKAPRPSDEPWNSCTV
ncbi:hypothetical protein TNCV_4515191 [Trichonephila clavipes]|nr:hypothetical protein TNCV_4515191 [Trichonephila clavipes]